MTIKHLVLPGGGAASIRLLGALRHTQENDVWFHDDIESIHAVSAGTLLAVLIALKFDWDAIIDYMIQRPWGDVFKVSLVNIFDVFLEKGFYSEDIFVTFMKPFFDSRDISLDITMQEFYVLTGVKLTFYAVELNAFELVQVSHDTFPDVSLIKAIHMSAAYPVLLSPVIMEGKCYVDGGLICNYPVNQCMRECATQSEILGIGSDESDNEMNRVSEESSLLEYIMVLIYNMVANLFDRVTDNEKRKQQEQLDNYLSIHIPSITMSDLQNTFNDIELRKQLLSDGEASAVAFVAEYTGRVGRTGRTGEPIVDSVTGNKSTVPDPDTFSFTDGLPIF
jgi:predicted acylesterase/phospholipase RssA